MNGPNNPGTRPRKDVEVFWREERETAWRELESVRNLQLKADPHSSLICTLECADLGPATRGLAGEFYGQVIVQRHYLGSSEMQFIPRASVQFRARVEGVELVIRAMHAEIPHLPQEYQAFEGRHQNHLSFTARPQEQPTVLDLFRQFPAVRPA